MRRDTERTMGTAKAALDEGALTTPNLETSDLACTPGTLENNIALHVTVTFIRCVLGFMAVRLPFVVAVLCHWCWSVC